MVYSACNAYFCVKIYFQSNVTVRSALQNIEICAIYTLVR